MTQDSRTPAPESTDREKVFNMIADLLSKSGKDMDPEVILGQLLTIPAQMKTSMILLGEILLELRAIRRVVSSSEENEMLEKTEAETPKTDKTPIFIIGPEKDYVKGLEGYDDVLK